MSKTNKRVRRLSTAMVTCALAITLTSCSGATNKYGTLDRNSTYASIGDYSVTTGELWDELQWNAKSVLDSQITNVILNEQITRLTNVINTNGDYSKLEDKKIIHGSTDEISEKQFNELYNEYTTRLADYVVQDILNLPYSIDSYYDKLDEFTDVELAKFKQKYVDEVYTTYQKASIADGDLKGKTFEDILTDLSAANTNGLFAIAKELSELYYPLYGKELFTLDSLKDDVEEAFEDDTDTDDEKYGLYSNTSYVDKFKELYTNTFDLNLIKIKFTSTTEFNDTLRAFGLYINNNTIYYIYEKEANQGYDSYIKYYDDFVKTSANLKTSNAEQVSGMVVLELYIMLYNYMYGGYLDSLPSATTSAISFDNLNDLRKQTLSLLNEYKTSDDPQALYTNTIKELEEFDKANGNILTYTPDLLKDTYSVDFKTYCYETLKLKDDQGVNYDTRYSTALKDASSSSVIAYKFDDGYDEITDATIKKYEDYYLDKNHTNIDYFDMLTLDENKELFDEILNELISDNATESIITNKMNDALEDVKVKVYTEATEIEYAKDHSDYSKSVGGAKNGNVLATISYNDKTFDLNIKADDSDKDSILIPGTSSAFGVYDYLEKQTGSTVAIDLLSKKIIRSTNEYDKLKKDSDTRKTYTTYLQNVLSLFANDGYSSSGYPSTIGKYNFLMLYYHTADINKIIDDYYITQLASAKLLTDYSDPSLAEFFVTYSTYAYEKYFSLSGKQLIIYMDADEDGEYDEVTEWKDDVVPGWIGYDGTLVGDVTKEYVAKQLAYTIYNKISASANSSHESVLSSLVTEINNSAKAEYNGNPTAAENIWAKYKKLGLNVAVEDVTATNSTTDIDYTIKQRLYDYARGHNEDNTVKYQYYLNETTPTEYIEPLTEASISTANDQIITSKTGVNLLIVTSGTATASAKWSKEDHEDTLYKDLLFKYNEKYIKISDVYNENDKLNENQILLYIIDNAVNGSSKLSPADISSALTNFVSPVYSRFTSSETQRVILLYFMKNYVNLDENIFNIIKYSNEAYNGDNGIFKNIVQINQRIADDYSDLNNDTTGTSNLYPDWWDNLEAHIKNFLIKLDKEAK
ncbi:MAG: hypothetical protein IJS83_06920 [Acholeplasmatales bacterium]|nr:hypothetical protein [Acholeplasmatales bacterium]